jgi:methylmalonyl-CoA mutase, C-terminal domain
LKRQHTGSVPVFAGGIIPDEDARRLKAAGVRAIFGPGASLEEIVTTAKKLARHGA